MSEKCANKARHYHS